MTAKICRLSLIVMGFVGVFCYASPAFAFFELSADPRKGGRDIRFDAGLTTQGVREEEMTVSVDTDQNIPYRIYLTLISPLTNEQGKTLPPSNLSIFSPTNSLGDLRARLETNLSLGQTVLYNSNSSGASDRFVLIFHLNVPDDLSGGIYRAPVSFTLEPVMPSAGLTPRTVNMEIRVESKPVFNVAVVNEKGAERLDLGRVSQKGVPAPGILQFHIENNTGQSFRIFQELREPLTSSTGQLFKENNVEYAVEGAQKGSMAPSGRLANSSTLLYESSPQGESVDFRVVYHLSDAANLASGRVSGTLLFRVESASAFAAQAIQTPVLLEVEPIFNLDIHIPDGLGLRFGNLRSGEEVQARRVILKVQSNLGVPYQVSQVLSRKMSTPDGAALPDNSFQYLVQKPATGSVEAIALRPVPAGESPIFLSDSNGTPEVIECQYSLSIPTQAKSGPYGTEVKYSITTL